MDSQPRPIVHHSLLAFGLAGMCMAPLAMAQHASTPKRSPPASEPQRVSDAAGRTSLNGELELAKLIDLCAAKLGLTVEYDAASLKGTLTVRLGDNLSDSELWSLANELLASRGFATVRRPGSSVYSVVKAADAPAAAGIERQAAQAAGPPAPGQAGNPLDPGISGDAAAGFTQLVVRAEHRDAKDVAEAVKSVLSKQTGTVTVVGDRGWLLITDFRPRIEQALFVKSLVDVPAETVSVATVPVEHVKPSDLIAAATGAAAGREEAGGRKLKGKLLASPDGAGIIVMSPAAEQEAWREIIAAFDRRQEVETRTYTPKSFSVAEVSQLVGQIGKDAGPRGSGDRWKVVADDLTGTLVVTATPSEHAGVAALLARLDSVPGGERKHFTIFTVRNRPVSELLALLDQLMSSGSLSVAASEADAARTAGPPEVTGANSSQQTMRDVMPPGSAPSLLGTSGQPVPGTGAVPPPPSQSTGPNSVGAPSASTAGSVTARAGGSGGKARASISRGVGPDGQPLVTVSADEATNSLIVVADARVTRQIESLLSKLDVRKAQVMLEILVVGLNDDQAVELGVELEKLIIDGSTLFSLTSLFGLTKATGPSPPPRAEGFNGVVLDPGNFSVVIHALENLNKGKTLNMPRLLVGNNQAANLTSVLQQPVLSTNASVSVATTSFGGTQDAGTTVTVKPQIAEGDHLLLDYSVAISSFIGTSTNPALPPPRQQNTLQSVVAVPDGFTVAVGGLQIDRQLESTSQVPLIGSIPVLGEAFKSRNNTVSTTRFFVFLKASILRQQGFEDLKYLSGGMLKESGLGDRDFPPVEPLVMR